MLRKMNWLRTLEGSVERDNESIISCCEAFLMTEVGVLCDPVELERSPPANVIGQGIVGVAIRSTIVLIRMTGAEGGTWRMKPACNS